MSDYRITVEKLSGPAGRPVTAAKECEGDGDNIAEALRALAGDMETFDESTWEAQNPASAPQCDGLCVTASDVGVSVPGDPVAYPHPGCPLHDPGQACGCGDPDRCLSPSHGQITTGEALEIRYRQSRGRR